MKITESACLLAELDSFDFEEVDVWGEGAQQVEDVMATVVSDDS